MASCSNDSKLKIWDLRKGKALYTLFGHTGRVNTVQFSYAGDFLASGGDDNSLLVWKSNFYNSGSSETRAIKQKKRRVDDKILVFPNKAQKVEEKSSLKKMKFSKEKNLIEIKGDEKVNTTLDKILLQLDGICDTLRVSFLD